MTKFVFRYALSFVVDRQYNLVFILGDTNFNLRLRIRIFDRVADQIIHHLLNP
ncbi:hypothetical protein THIOM_004387 [Candidatus Thiomargarita nelsonii]|uniref:Uncharacterized protein n=1 Tax=Candidatus Thiomargarita nelsonii TaxID=1003181 RepID=A0A176RVZ2_9GAMM|nr:hypothetical protein THIOM_004387 [Candidatus Thiomargarita nelsonii]